MNATRQPIVAIDGPAGSGKSTVAKLAAERSGLQFISSGAMYRAVALRALRDGIAPANGARLTALAAQLCFRFSTDPDGTVHTVIDDEDVTEALRAPVVAEMASTVATIPAVRAALVAKLREYGQHGGVVMEGRDIQTVVFPAAEIKVYLTASDEERARRRWQELDAAGRPCAFDTVLAEVRARDQRDSGRAASPLRAADDAISVDTDGRTIEQVVHCLVQLITTWRAHPALRGARLAQQANLTGEDC